MAAITTLLPSQELIDAAIARARKGDINWDRPHDELVRQLDERKSNATLEAIATGVIGGAGLGVIASFLICVPFGIHGTAAMAVLAVCWAVTTILTGRLFYTLSPWAKVEIPEDLTEQRALQFNELCEVRSYCEGDRFVRHVRVAGEIVWQHQEPIELDASAGLAIAATWVAGDEYTANCIATRQLPKQNVQLPLADGLKTLGRYASS
jgi:hypothetical protein